MTGLVHINNHKFSSHLCCRHSFRSLMHSVSVNCMLHIWRGMLRFILLTVAARFIPNVCRFLCLRRGKKTFSTSLDIIFWVESTVITADCSISISCNYRYLRCIELSFDCCDVYQQKKNLILLCHRSEDEEEVQPLDDISSLCFPFKLKFLSLCVPISFKTFNYSS